jgi:Sulfotransferase domain
MDKIPKLSRLVVFNAQAIRPRAKVQFLLDYAVIGFAKCGTTTLSLWLDSHPEISDFPMEVWDLYHGMEVKFIKRLYEKVMEEASGGVNQRRIHGYKCPGDITHDRPLQTLREHFPKTKLIVSMRHPLLFFQSFYNYRASIKQFHRIPGKPNDLIGPEKQYDILATSQAAFHVFLASLGKTDMTSDEERQLLRGFYKDEILETTPPIRMPQKVFLMDTKQLADVNATRSEIFRQDMESFLGLQQPLASIPHARPNAHHEQRFQHQVKRLIGGKINICDDEHMLVRQELMRISRAASQWIRFYLLQSPDVVVSSPEFFDEAIQAWMLDPCDEQSSSASYYDANTTTTTTTTTIASISQ